MGTALTIVAGIGSIFVAISIGLLKDEVAAFLPIWTKRILQISVRLLPERDRERREEEWRSHIDEYPGKLTQLVQSCRLIIAGAMMNDLHRKRMRLFVKLFTAETIGGWAGVFIGLFLGVDWPSGHDWVWLIPTCTTMNFVLTIPSLIIYERAVKRRLRLEQRRKNTG